MFEPSRRPLSSFFMKNIFIILFISLLFMSSADTIKFYKPSEKRIIFNKKKDVISSIQKKLIKKGDILYPAKNTRMKTFRQLIQWCAINIYLNSSERLFYVLILLIFLVKNLLFLDDRVLEMLGLLIFGKIFMELSLFLSGFVARIRSRICQICGLTVRIMFCEDNETDYETSDVLRSRNQLSCLPDSNYRFFWLFSRFKAQLTFVL